MDTSVFVKLPIGNLVLASASKVRAKMLTDSGLAFSQYPVNIDEESIRASGLASDMPPSEIAVILAEMKAATVSQHFIANQASSEHYILGCDQILFCDNRIYNKPKDLASAKSQLLSLSGKTHQLFTAAVLFRHGSRIWHHLSSADMTMRPFEKDFIEAYLQKLGNTALTSPASYHIEGLGSHLFSKIKGCHYGILGLPLLEVLSILREHGLSSNGDRL